MMEPETARNIGYALGMAAMGYVVLQVLNRGRKPPPTASPNPGRNVQGGIRAAGVLVAIGVGAAAVGYFMNRESRAPDYDQYCAAPLRSTAEIEQALSDGYEVDRSRRCISKNGYEEISRNRRPRS